jgi:hypothetical protein
MVTTVAPFDLGDGSVGQAGCVADLTETDASLTELEDQPVPLLGGLASLDCFGCELLAELLIVHRRFSLV